MVHAESCLCRWIGKDIMASVRNWTIGGELETYTKIMNESVELITDRLLAQAEVLGADAIYGLRFSTSTIVQGAAELIGYGTAVRYVD